MLTRFSLPAFLLLTVYLTGCSVVEFQHPVGEAIQEEDRLAELAGVWTTGRG